MRERTTDEQDEWDSLIDELFALDAAHPYIGQTIEYDADDTTANAFNPDEPRDDHGRWTDGGGGGDSEAARQAQLARGRLMGGGERFSPGRGEIVAKSTPPNPFKDAKGRGANFKKKGFGQWTGPHGSLALVALKPEEQKALPKNRLDDFWKNRRELERLNKQMRAKFQEGDFQVKEFQEKRTLAKALHDELVKIKGEAKGLVRPEDVAARKDAERAMRDRGKAAEAQLRRDEAAKPAVQVPIVGHPEQMTPVERGMMTSPVTENKKLGGGINKTFKVKLADGTVGVWKPSDGEAEFVRDNVPNGAGYLREAAAYGVARAIGHDDLVPPTIVRTIDGKEGSLMRWVDNAKIGMEVQDNSNTYGAHQIAKAAYDGDEQLARLAAFDALIGNTDRHGANWMVQGPNDVVRRGEGKLVAIDNGLAFPTTNDGFRSWPLDEANKRGVKVPKEVLNWDGDKIAKVMTDYGLDRKAVDRTLERLAILKQWAKEDMIFPYEKYERGQLLHHDKQDNVVFEPKRPFGLKFGARRPVFGF